MKNIKSTITLVLKAGAVGLAVAAAVLGYLGAASLEAQVSLLALGLAFLAVASLQKDAFSS